MSPRRLLLPLLLVTLFGTLDSSDLVLESGYSVTTVVDFNKPLPSGGLDGSGVHPFSLHSLTRSPNRLLLLDSTNSTFYFLDLPLSQESRIKLLSGKRTAGFSDGDAVSAMFNRPRSFAVDYSDNVYVADQINHVIRKINGFSGMTSTIAGGYSEKAGHIDGPAQNATFSENFDLFFMPKMCCLLIADRGSSMIRQMDLKPEDCEKNPQSSKGLGAIPVTAMAVVALVCGFALGFRARPFMTSSSSEAFMSHCALHSWNHIQTTRRKPAAPMFCSGIRSVVASFKPEIFQEGKIRADFVSSNHTVKLQQSTDERNDLIDFEEQLSVLDLSSSTNQQVETEEASGRNLLDSEDEGSLNGKIDNMIVANLMDFSTQCKQQSLVKRRLNGAHDLSI